MTWDQIAQKVGRTDRQVYRWRHSEAWEIAFREAGQEYVDRLLPAAVSALIRAWSKGNPSGALEVLRSYGYLRNERVEVSHSIDAAELQRVIAEVIEDPAQRRRLAERLVTLPG